MNDELREMVLNAVYILFRGEGITRIFPNPKRIISIPWITQQVQCFTKKEIDSNQVRIAANELSLSGYLKKKEETYSITEKGIVYIEGESKFLKEEKNSEIVIGNINISDVHAPIAIGKNINININQTYNELHQHLETLSEAVQDADIDEAVKKDSLAEIITIDTQLSKREPNKNIIREAWNVLEKLTTIGALFGFIERIRPFIVKLFT